MAESFTFELVSPERLLVSEQVESVVIPGSEGEMTVMANHAPVMSTIKPGVVTVKTASGKEERFVVFRRFRRHPAEELHASAEIFGSCPGFRQGRSGPSHPVGPRGAVRASDDAHKTKLEQFLHHLAALEDAV